jgi:hypothetical protein
LCQLSFAVAPTVSEELMRSLDVIIRDTLGNNAITIVQLTAEIERLQEELKNLKAEKESN